MPATKGAKAEPAKAEPTTKPPVVKAKSSAKYKPFGPALRKYGVIGAIRASYVDLGGVQSFDGVRKYIRSIPALKDVGFQGYKDWATVSIYSTKLTTDELIQALENAAKTPNAPPTNTVGSNKKVMAIQSSGRADIKGMVQVNAAALGGYTVHADQKAYLQGLPGMPSDFWINGDSKGYYVLSHTHTGAQLYKILSGKSSFVKTAAPKAQPQATTSAKPAASLEDGLRYIKSEMQMVERQTSSWSMAEWQGPLESEYTKGEFEMDCRHWGTWQVPDDVEDDGDYDWEELSSKSRQQMRDIMQNAEKRYPHIKFGWQTGEKNYIYISAKMK